MTEPMKTLEQLQQDWGNSTCSKEPEQYIYDYMKNQVLAERERIKEKVRELMFTMPTGRVPREGLNIAFYKVLELIDSL